MLTVIAHAWLSGINCIGVAITHNPENEETPYKAWIGSVSGNYPKADLEFLASFGTKLNLWAGIALVEAHGEWYSQTEHLGIYSIAAKEGLRTKMDNKIPHDQ